MNIVKQICLASSLFWVLLAQVQAADLPAVFAGDDPNSSLSVSYADLDVFLEAHVLNVGPSTREKAPAAKSAIGTKLRVKINRYTVLEGNRFFFENLEKPEVRDILRSLKESLEQLPAEAPLALLTKDEQLAYWLNLYNFTLLNELASIYPKSSLHKVLDYGDDDSILAKKILKVAGVSLSLDDIQFVILKHKFDAHPLIIYGLFQGNIGGPNIRREAYTGENVWRLLERNAINFVNSNRGTYYGGRNSARASVLYERNMDFFNNDVQVLRAHLLDFLIDDVAEAVRSAKTIDADIKDWSFADMFGNTRQFGQGYHTNSAALLDSVKATQPGEPGQTVPIQQYLADDIQNKARMNMRFSDLELQVLSKLKEREMYNSGTVEVKDLDTTEMEQVQSNKK